MEQGLSLLLSISEERLEPYRRDGAPLDVAMARYRVNLELAEALYPSLHAVEIALRNSIHRACALHFKKPDWFQSPTCALETPERARVDAAIVELQSKKKPTNPGDVVAALSFGFWVSLFNGSYCHGSGRLNLWPPLLRSVLPALPRGRIGGQRDDVKHVRWVLGLTRELRNRVLHHERISHLSDLKERYTRARDLVAWISPEMRDLVRGIDRFPRVLERAGDLANERNTSLTPAA
jgi:hypothetical protein